MYLQARWKHDCSNCKFIGLMDGVDMYICIKESMIEVVARHSDESSDYWSGSVCK